MEETMIKADSLGGAILDLILTNSKVQNAEEIAESCERNLRGLHTDWCDFYLYLRDECLFDTALSEQITSVCYQWLTAKPCIESARKNKKE